MAKNADIINDVYVISKIITISTKNYHYTMIRTESGYIPYPDNLVYRGKEFIACDDRSRILARFKGL